MVNSTFARRIVFCLGGAFSIGVSLPIFLEYVQRDPNNTHDGFSYIFLETPLALIAAIILSMGIVFMLYGVFFGRIRSDVMARLNSYKPVLLMSVGILFILLNYLALVTQNAILESFFGTGFLSGGIILIVGFLLWLIGIVKKMRNNQ